MRRRWTSRESQHLQAEKIPHRHEDGRCRRGGKVRVPTRRMTGSSRETCGKGVRHQPQARSGKEPTSQSTWSWSGEREEDVTRRRWRWRWVRGLGAFHYHQRRKAHLIGARGDPAVGRRRSSGRGSREISCGRAGRHVAIARCR